MAQEITLTYLGRRLGKADKLYFVYDYDGRELWYSKVKHSVVGGQYTVDADLGDDGSVRIYPRTLRYAGEKHSDSAQVAVWEASDADAWSQSRQKATERKHARSSELDEALLPVIAIVQAAKTRAEAQAVLRVIGDRLDRAWWVR